MPILKRGNSFLIVGHSMTRYDGPVLPPEPPTEKFLQFTNRGSTSVDIILNSATKGNIFVDDTFVSKFDANSNTVITIPARGVLKLTGATPQRSESSPLLRDSTTGTLSLDRFDESITNYEFAFCYFKDLKSITSWEGADKITSFKDAFNATGLVSLPSSWEGLDSLTTLWGAFNNCTALTAIPDSWAGLETVTATYCAFSNCTNLVNGGISGFDSFRSLNTVWYMFYRDSAWTGDAYSLYEQFQNLGIYPTNVFNNCTNSIGWNNIPRSWGGGLN